MGTLTLIDTHILDYLLFAMAGGETPLMDHEKLREQKVATLRLFLWTELHVGRVVAQELTNVSDDDKRRLLESIISSNLPEVWVQEHDQGRWSTRTTELGKHHNGPVDCQLVAEAEIIGATTLLSFDKTMVRRLRQHAACRLLSPSEYWDELAIPRGTPPKWTPAPSNPLASVTFWRWE